MRVGNLCLQSLLGNRSCSFKSTSCWHTMNLLICWCHSGNMRINGETAVCGKRTMWQLQRRIFVIYAAAWWQHMHCRHCGMIEHVKKTLIKHWSCLISSKSHNLTANCVVWTGLESLIRMQLFMLKAKQTFYFRSHKSLF